MEFTLTVPSVSVGEAQSEPPADDALIAKRVSSSSAPQRRLSPVVRETYAAPIQPLVATIRRPERQPEAEPRIIDRSASRPRTPAVIPILIMFAGYVLIGAFLIARPRIADFALPATAMPLTSVPVLYQTSGFGTADYTVLGPDAAPIAEGPLALGGSSFNFTLPKAAAAQAYLVRVRMRSFLGSAVAENYLHVPAPPATPAPPAPRRRHIAAPLAPPQIHSLALDRATVTSGDTLNVYYDIAATSGTVALVDPAAQITYGKSALDMSGHTSFTAPGTDIPRFLTVIVTAVRGKATTESRSGVSLTPPVAVAPAQSDAGDAGLPSAGALGTSGSAMPGRPSAVTISAPPSVHSQQPIRVDVGGAAAGLLLVLLDDAGNEVAHRDIPAGRSRSVFRAPAVRTRSQFMLEATSPRGTGAETIVKPIVVLP